MSNSLGPDQDRRSVDPDLDPNCLQSFSADDMMMAFFEINFLKKNLSGTQSECPTVWIQNRTDVMWVLIYDSKLFAKVISR